MELFTTRLGVRSMLSVLVFLVLAGMLLAGCTAQKPATEDTTPTIDRGQPTDTADTRPGVDKTNESIAQAVADGTYEKDATYRYHSGTEEVRFMITVENDVVTNVSVTSENPSSPVSRNIIANYSAELPSLVIGKKITELDLPANVAGSSLTNGAFKAYVNEVIENN